MGENPSNFYNDNVKYANPPSGGCNWDLDYYRTNYINAILLGQLKEGNYIKSGLVPTQGTGLNIEVTAGVAVIGGVEYSVNAFTKQAVLAPLGSVEFNLIYVDSSGVGQSIQSDPSVIGCALAIVDTDDTAILRFMNAVQLLQYDTTPNPVFQNHIIDGDFNFWYEGISQTTSGYGSDTMWSNSNIGTTKVHSQQSFDNGQVDVPGNLFYFSRTVVNSVVGSGNLCVKSQKIEGVDASSGRDVTISFYAKADSAKNIAIEFKQQFGSGGSPSATIDGIGSQNIALTTVWTKYVVTVNLPSISGKIKGTDNNDYLQITIWFDAGSDYNSRTDNLGQQSGTFDIARIRLVEGEEEGDNIDEVYGEVANMVGRYFEMSYPIDASIGEAINSGSYKSALLTAWLLMVGTVGFAVVKRADPTMTIYSSYDGASANMAEYTVGGVFVANRTPTSMVSCHSSFEFNANGVPTPDNYIRAHWTADARL